MNGTPRSEPPILPATLTCPQLPISRMQSSLYYSQPPPQPVHTILRDGYIAYTFGEECAETFLQFLLKLPPRSLTTTFSVSGWAGSFSLPQAVVPSIRANILCSLGQPHLLLDYLVDNTRGAVVPQALWAPRSNRDMTHYVVDASLLLPTFFIRNTGTIGLSLIDAAAGNCGSLVGCSQPVNVGGRTSVHLRIQWPGYNEWKRQFQTRDETVNRNIITLEKFVRHVGRSVDRFMEAAASEISQGAPTWLIGPGRITREDVVVVGVVHVSAGSWMPILQLRRRLSPA
ncbi:hypothetical protein OF83DRAFT_1171023 [Amylostereum chailletii]|nr:hypothetical protein OF83DRAFT_1171023 [Amylostereum chailletii]